MKMFKKTQFQIHDEIALMQNAGIVKVDKYERRPAGNEWDVMVTQEGNPKTSLRIAPLPNEAEEVFYALTFKTPELVVTFAAWLAS